MPNTTALAFASLSLLIFWLNPFILFPALVAGHFSDNWRHVTFRTAIIAFANLLGGFLVMVLSQGGLSALGKALLEAVVQLPQLLLGAALLFAFAWLAAACWAAPVFFLSNRRRSKGQAAASA